MDFRIADTFTDSLARLTGDEEKTVKTTSWAIPSAIALAAAAALTLWWGVQAHGLLEQAQRSVLGLM
jgi:hypothetical protein